MVLWPATLTYHFVFDHLVSLRLFFPQYVFLNRELHPLSYLLLRRGIVTLVIAGSQRRL